MPITFLFQFDWNNNGTWIDEAAEVITAKLRSGLPAGALLTDVVAQPGTCVIVLDNSSQRYSPDYAGGPLYGKLTPRRPMRVQATDGVTTWTLFRGYVERIEPDSGPYGRRRVQITCVDAIGLLRDQKVSMDLQENQRADQLIAGAINLVFGAPAASATITLTSNAINNQTVTINGQTYTFKTALTPNAYEVTTGANTAATAANLKAAINNEGVVGTNYAGGNSRLAGITASVSGSVVTLTATLPGANGNAYTLSKNGTGISITGFAGGADYPSGLTSYSQSRETYDIAADRWTGDQTSAMDIIEQAAMSDQGRFFVQRNGTLTYHDRLWFFKPLAVALALNASPFQMESGQRIDRIFNVVKVTIRPRATVGSTTVIASASTSIRIPPLGPSGPGQRRVTLHFRDSAGNLIGGKDIVLPLAQFTDYTVGVDKTDSYYTNLPYFYFGPIEVKASEITLTMYNTAVGQLLVNNLQVRGKPITVYDPVTLTQEDSASQALYQKRTLSLHLPLSSDENFAEAYAQYLLERYKAPFTNVDRIVINNEPTIGGVNVFSINLYDVLSVTDSQTSISAIKCWVTGMEVEITPSGFTLAWHTVRADDRQYWNLGVNGLGELDATTKLAA